MRREKIGMNECFSLLVSSITIFPPLEESFFSPASACFSKRLAVRQKVHFETKLSANGW